MNISPHNNNSSSSLELTIALPAISSSEYLHYVGEHAMLRDYLDINQVPSSEGSEERFNDEEEEDCPGARQKKLRLTREQSLLLEQNFRQNHILNQDQKAALATELNLKPRQVEVWFQNRRARSKVKQTETEFEYLKRWVVSLTEQNKRLQQELEDLRTTRRVCREGPSGSLLDCSPLNLSLTMCPGCKSVVTHATASTTTDVSSAEAFLPPRNSASCHNS